MKLLTVKDVAQMLCLSQSKIYDMAGKSLRCVRIGGAVRFREEDVLEYISDCVVEVKLEPRRRTTTAKLRHLRV